MVVSILESVIGAMPVPRGIACSGGVDSLLLALIAHRLAPSDTVVFHAVSPAVPREATARVVEVAGLEGWRLECLDAGELLDRNYVSNPVNRCYFCKSRLYSSVQAWFDQAGIEVGVLLSGANMDDLGDYRPGLIAAAEHGVRHPYIEAHVDKAGIRAMARSLGVVFADLPASPCLSSRIYTATPVTVERLRAIEAGEKVLRSVAEVSVARCRVQGDQMLIEVADGEQNRVTQDAIAAVARAVLREYPGLTSISLDDRPYRMGRAFVGAR